MTTQKLPGPPDGDRFVSGVRLHYCDLLILWGGKESNDSVGKGRDSDEGSGVSTRVQKQRRRWGEREKTYHVARLA